MVWRSLPTFSPFMRRAESGDPCQRVRQDKVFALKLLRFLRWLLLSAPQCLPALRFGLTMRSLLFPLMTRNKNTSLVLTWTAKWKRFKLLIQLPALWKNVLILFHKAFYFLYFYLIWTSIILQKWWPFHPFDPFVLEMYYSLIRAFKLSNILIYHWYILKLLFTFLLILYWFFFFFLNDIRYM